MPSRSAARGPSIVTTTPSTAISPASAGSAPARIFISVDLPAPFSPTSAWTSAAVTSKLTPSSARTPGNVFTMPAIRNSGAECAESLTSAAGVGLRVDPDRNGDELRRRLAREVVVDRVDRARADLVGVLDRVAGHRTAGDRGPRLGRRVVTDHRDLPLQPGGVDGGRRAQRRVVVDPEDALEVAVRLQDVVHRRGGLGALAAAVDVGDDLHPRAAARERRLEAAHPILDRGDLGLVEDRDRPARAGDLTHQRAGLLAALDVVAGDVGDDRALLRLAGDVGGENRDVGVVGLDDRAADRLRVVRGEDDRVDLLGDEVLDLTLLLDVVPRGVDDVDPIAVLSGLGLHP